MFWFFEPKIITIPKLNKRALRDAEKLHVLVHPLWWKYALHDKDMKGVKDQNKFFLGKYFKHLNYPLVIVLPNKTESEEFEYEKNILAINELTKDIANVYYIESKERYNWVVKENDLKLFKWYNWKFIFAGGYIWRCLRSAVIWMYDTANASADVRFDCCQVKPFEVADCMSVKEKRKLFYKTI